MKLAAATLCAAAVLCALGSTPAAGQTQPPIPKTGRLPNGQQGTSDLDLSGVFGTKQDVNGDSSGQHVLITGTSKVLTIAAAAAMNGLNAKAFGAICDGNSHLLSSVFPTLAAAQAVYPGYQLTDEVDGAAIQKAHDALFAAGGGTVWSPIGYCRASRTIFWASQVHLNGFGRIASMLFKVGDAGPMFIVGAAAAPGAGPTVTAYFGFHDVGFSRDTSGQTVGNAAYIRTVGATQAEIARVSVAGVFEGFDIQGGSHIAVDDVAASANYLPGGTYNPTTKVSTKGAHYLVKTSMGPAPVGGTGGVAQTLPTWIRVSRVSQVALAQTRPPAGSYIPYGPTYGFWITACESCSFDRSYSGHSQVADLLIEQGADEAPILDNDYTANYFDASGGQSVAIMPSGVPASMTHDGIARVGSAGANAILNQRFRGGTINGSGNGRQGLYVDSVLRGAGTAFPQGVLSLSVEGVDFSGHLGSCIFLGSGIGTVIRGGRVKGCNYWGETGASGIVVGANTVRTLIDVPFVGGGAAGAVDASGHQVYGIDVQAGAQKVILGTMDLAGNGTPLRLLSSDVIAARLTAEADAITLAPTEGQVLTPPALTKTIALAPAAARTAVSLWMPSSPIEGDTVFVSVTSASIGTLTLLTDAGGSISNGTVSSAAPGPALELRYSAGVWRRLL